MPIVNQIPCVMSLPGNSGSWINLGNPSKLPQSGSITMMAWICPLATDLFRTIIGHGNTQNPNADLSLRISVGNYQIVSWDGTDHCASAPVPASDIGQWVHLAGVYDQTAQCFILYRNGLEIARTASSIGIVTAAVNWSIGANCDGTARNFKGSIAGASIWSSALHPGIIQGAMNNGLAGQEPGLVGLWLLNDGLGQSIVDRASSPANGTASGITWAPGIINALNFTGNAGSYVNLGNPSKALVSGKITLMAWINPQDSSSLRDIIAKGPTGGEIYMRLAAGSYQCGTWNGPDYVVAYPMPAGDIGQWIHLAGVFDGANWILYRNGIEVARTASTQGAICGSAPWSIGAAFDGSSRNFKGAIGGASIWNLALDAASVRCAMQNGISGQETGVVGYWPLSEGAGQTPAIDHSFNPANGTVTAASFSAATVPPGVVSLVSSNPLTLRGTRFDGTRTIPIGLPSEIGLYNGDFTVEAWIRPTGDTSQRFVILGTSTTNNNQGLHLAIQAGGKLYMGFFGNDTAGTSLIPQNAWTHVAFRYTLATHEQAIFVNGVLDASSTGHAPFIGTAMTTVGMSWSDLFVGSIDELRVFGVARSQLEIQRDMNQRLLGTESGLRAHLPFTDATQSVLHLDGASGYVQLPAINIPFTAGITLEAWVYFRSFNSWARIFDFGNGQTGNILLANAGTTNQLAFQIHAGNQTTGVIDSAGSLQIGHWMHIAATLDSTGHAVLYKNGAKIAEGPMTPVSSISRVNSFIGKSNWSVDGAFNGMIAEARLWNRACTATEIAANYGHRLAGNETGLCGYWPMTSLNGVTVQDLSPSRNHGTLQGASATASRIARFPIPLSGWCAGLSSVTHEGKVVVFGTGYDGQIRYTVKQTGFEDTAVSTQTTLPGWEDWKFLTLPNQDDDTSVTSLEATTQTYASDSQRYILRSLYRTSSSTAKFPVQVISAMEHLYVFRQSTSGTLLCDRFVLDGISNELSPTLEVRYKRSRMRNQPLLPPTGNAGTLVFDSLDYSDANGNPFYEPTIELSTLNQIYNGRFAVAVLPAGEDDRSRWHFFFQSRVTGSLDVVSIRSTDDGLFDLSDHRSVLDRSPIMGIIHQRLSLNGAKMIAGPAATRFDLQTAQVTASGATALVRGATHVMLAVPTDQGTATFDFGTSVDGTLVDVDGNAVITALRSDARELLLPLTDLDDIREVGAPPVASGSISAMTRAADDSVVINTTSTTGLNIGDVVKISNTASYDGNYSISRQDGNSFSIAAPMPTGDLGHWEQVRADRAGEVFDGAITGFAKAADKVLVTAFNHGMNDADKVQVIDTISCDGTYTVSNLDTTTFTLDRTFQTGTAVNIRAQLATRRGLRLDPTQSQFVSMPQISVPGGTNSYTLEAWIKPDTMRSAGIVGWGNSATAQNATALVLTPTGLLHDWGGNNALSATTPSLTDGWHHVAATYDATTKTRRLFLDGVQVAQDSPTGTRAAAVLANDFSAGKTTGRDYFSGLLAEVRVWSEARSAAVLSANMYLTLTGNESDLVGYWPLGAVVEGSVRTVVELTPVGADGVVNGGAYVSGRTFQHTPTGWGTMQLVMLQNDELIAVTQGMNYQESFEIRIDNGTPGTTFIFGFSYWGKLGQNSDDIVLFDPSYFAPNTPQTLNSGAGWQQVTCTFTVPDGMSQVRLFELGSIAGTWSSIEIRKHRIQEQPSAISEEVRVKTVTPAPILTAAANVASDARRLDFLLREEGRVRPEKEALDILIYQASNQSLISDQIATMKTAISTATGQLTDAQNLRATQVGRSWDFWFRLCRPQIDPSGGPIFGSLSLPSGIIAVDGSGLTQGSQIIEISPRGADTDNSLFYCDSAPDGYFVIVAKNGMVWEASGTADGSPIILNVRTNLPNQQFSFAMNGGGSFSLLTITVRQTGKYLTVNWDQLSRPGAHRLPLTQASNPNALFQLVDNFQNVAESPTTQATLDRIQTLTNTLATLNSQLATLQLAQSAAQSQIAAWIAQRQKLIDLLNAIWTEIGTRNASLLSASAAPPQAMPLLTTDKNGLQLTSALLASVQPTGRLSAAEICEGNVQLSYIDADGRGRIALYDATADSANTSFMQWLPQKPFTALGSTSNTFSSWLNWAVSLSPQPFLSNAWTVGAWCYFPLPRPDYPAAMWSTLVDSATGAPIVVQDGRLLGSRIASGNPSTTSFVDCGTDLSLLDPGWHHVAAVGSGSGTTSTTTFYIDGQPVGDLKAKAVADQNAVIQKAAAGDVANQQNILTTIQAAPYKFTDSLSRIGNSLDGTQPFGRIAGLRIWSAALTDAEVESDTYAVLSGNEPGLIAYYDAAASGSTALLTELTGKGPVPSLSGNITALACTAPIGSPAAGADSMVSVDYSTVAIDGQSGEQVSYMRRALLCPSPAGVSLLGDRRIEALDLLWIGNAQFAPTLLGYIEGAPPVPSENLTEQDSYNGATTVSLNMSQDMTLSWNQSKQSSAGWDINLFVGADEELDEGVAGIAFIASKAVKWRLGVKTTSTGSTTDSNESTVSEESGSQTIDQLTLRGTRETTANFPYLGRRFIPKSVGYALVVSGVADVYISRLTRSGKMIGYQLVPNPDIPPDVNTMTFLLNPAYTMAGSLDGLTGSAATSDRFYRHVPELRKQYGSRYPASYFRVDEAYDLKTQLDAEDKRREAFFFNFNASLKTLGPLGADTMDSRISDGPAPNTAVVGGQSSTTSTTGTTSTTTDASSAATAQAQSATTTATAGQQDFQSTVDERRTQIQQSQNDPDAIANATQGLATWQQRMEDLRVQAGKRNIVNTYVWDADGGLHAETQQFASNVEHSIGSAASVNWGTGADGKAIIAGFGFEATVLGTANWSQTLSKTISTSSGFSLNVDLSGVEGSNVTDYKGRPFLPGEKVSRYRFMSFYLEGSTQNFNDFFSYVVDPEWLAGNSESARSLRTVKTGKSNKTWRVLHRVTYVERAALDNFGQDPRSIVRNQVPPPSLEDRVAQLTDDNQQLKTKLDQILALLQQPH